MWSKSLSGRATAQAATSWVYYRQPPQRKAGGQGPAPEVDVTGGENESAEEASERDQQADAQDKRSLQQCQTKPGRTPLETSSYKTTKVGSTTQAGWGIRMSNNIDRSVLRPIPTSVPWGHLWGL